MKERLTAKQLQALRIAAKFGRVIQFWGDDDDSRRTTTHAAGVTLESLRARGLLKEYEGPRYMPVYLLTDKGREALK